MFYLQCFDYTLPEEDYQSIIKTLQIENFANYREVQLRSITNIVSFHHHTDKEAIE